MNESDETYLDVLLSLIGPARIRYTPCRPTPRQEALLLLRDKEVLYAGGAGGGKSVGLLMAALQYADVPGYNALIVRPSLVELYLAGGLLSLAHDWLAGSKAHWSGATNTFRFPGPGRSGAGGAVLTFGYLAHENDVGHYNGSSYSFLGFDELTKYEESHYTRLFRALRQAPEATFGAAPDGTTLANVPARIRSTANPGGPGHGWVKDRFIDGSTRPAGVVYLPSRLEDNPYLDHASYVATLKQLRPADRERLLNGNWEMPDEGERFQRDWFDLIEPHQLPDSGYSAIRSWDLAATVPSHLNRDPDYTVGLKLFWHRSSGTYYISDIVRERLAPGDVEQLVAATAERDGKSVRIVIEREPGSAGVHTADHFVRHVLAGYPAIAIAVSGDKDTRAWPVAAAAQSGLVKLVRGRHTNAFLDELCSFPHGKHDDCVDALSAAHKNIDTHIPYMRTYVARGRIDQPGMGSGPRRRGRVNPLSTFRGTVPDEQS